MGARPVAGVESFRRTEAFELAGKAFQRGVMDCHATADIASLQVPSWIDLERGWQPVPISRLEVTR